MYPTPRMLEQFIVLAEEEHFGRAAARLSIQQPPLTQAIQRLERILGVALLDRSTRTVTLTEAGQQFATDARRVLSLQQASTERVRRVAEGTAGLIRLGFVAGLSPVVLPKLLSGLRVAAPGVSIDLEQGTTLDLGAKVSSGELDAALTRGPRPTWPGVSETLLFAESIGVAVPRGHRVATNQDIWLADLAQEPFVMPSATAMPGLHRLLYELCASAGFVPRTDAASDTLAGMLALISAGLCVGLAPADTLGDTDPRVSFVRLRDQRSMLSLPVLLLHRSDEMSPAVRRLLEVAARYDRNVSEPDAAIAT